MREKRFDCVQKKWEWQAQVQGQLHGLTQMEQRHRTVEIILADPILGPLWRRMREAQPRAQEADVPKGSGPG